MKRLYLICLGLLTAGLVSSATGGMAVIQILSEQYHVWGTIPTDSYDLNSTNGSQISDSVRGFGGLASSGAGPTADHYSFAVTAFSNGFQGNSIIDASAEITVFFQPAISGWLRPMITLYSDNVPGLSLHASLIDMTAGAVLFDATSGDTFQFFTDVYDAHTYCLFIGAYSQVVKGGSGGSASVAAEIPEPACLPLLGFGGLLFRSRK